MSPFAADEGVPATSFFGGPSKDEHADKHVQSASASADLRDRRRSCPASDGGAARSGPVDGARAAGACAWLFGRLLHAGGGNADPVRPAHRGARTRRPDHRDTASQRDSTVQHPGTAPDPAPRHPAPRHPARRLPAPRTPRRRRQRAPPRNPPRRRALPHRPRAPTRPHRRPRFRTTWRRTPLPRRMRPISKQVNREARHPRPVAPLLCKRPLRSAARVTLRWGPAGRRAAFGRR